jgi:hypothetical protein
LCVRIRASELERERERERERKREREEGSHALKQQALQVDACEWREHVCGRKLGDEDEPAAASRLWASMVDSAMHVTDSVLARGAECMS